MVRSSVHLGRVDNRAGRVVDHWSGVVGHWGSMMDSVVDNWSGVVDSMVDWSRMVNHRSGVDESGHHWLLLLLRCSQIHGFNRVSSNLFLSDSLLNFFNSFFHNCLDNLLLNCFLHRFLYSSNLCRLSNLDVVVNANRQLATEDGGVRSVDSMVDNRGGMVDDGRAAVDCVVYKGGMLDRSVMDS